MSTCTRRSGGRVRAEEGNGSPVVERDVSVAVEEFQFLIADRDGDSIRAMVPADNGVVELQEGVVCVRTGAHFGRVRVSVVVDAKEPPSNPDDWQDVVEVSLRVRAGLVIMPLTQGVSPNVPELADLGPGDYRLRISARDRDLSSRRFSYDEPTGLLSERFRIEIWPSPPAPPQVLKVAAMTALVEGHGQHTSTSTWAAADEAIERLIGALGATSEGDRVIRISTSVPAAQEKVFRRVAGLYGWFTDNYQPPAAHKVGQRFTMREPMCGYEIRCQYQQLKHPETMAVSWEWRTLSSQKLGGQGATKVGCCWRSGVRFVLTPSGDHGETYVEVAHSNVPSVLALDLTTIWQRQLERLRSIFELGYSGRPPGIPVEH